MTAQTPSTALAARQPRSEPAADHRRNPWNAPLAAACTASVAATLGTVTAAVVEAPHTYLTAGSYTVVALWAATLGCSWAQSRHETTNHH